MPATILPSVQQILNRYIMSTSFTMGLLGNLCCSIVFFKNSNPRTACSIYFFALSISTNVYLLWSVPLIFYTLDHVDPQTKSLVYCKMRIYISHVLGLYTRYLIVLACIDVFFLTRSNVRIRLWSSTKIAYLLTATVCVACPTVASHFPIFMDLRGSTCGLFDSYRYFFGIYQLVLVSLLPSVLMGIFGILAVRTIHQRGTALTSVRRRDRDLMRMIVAEILINIIASIPLSANLIYTAATISLMNKSAERIEIDAFMNFLGQFINQGIFIAPFYLFILSSKSFRHDFQQIVNTFWFKYIRRQNRVTQINARPVTFTKHHETGFPKTTI
ncbi:unnamed protein product [Adineta ricciae]|uniref:G-protein coupled receptors family 1 profile domain-containing protein n=2 Tax=Adineta ricciae TaxID=249248 RepID=A0A815JB53_ADIRI|nr:unnamed protein product [Adineta ricciae]